MKFHVVGSGNSMIDVCSLKIRFFCLVVNTAQFINERASPTLGFTHAVLGPMAIVTTYVFLGTFVIGSIRNKRPSQFIQVYALLTCITIEISLSVTVFQVLRTLGETPAHSSLILDGVLPIFIASLLSADLIMVLFSFRQELSSIVQDQTTQ